MRKVVAKKKALPAIDLLFTLEEMEGPAATWEGRCSSLAAAALKTGVEGDLIRGTWTGPIASGTVFSDRPITQHTWILLKNGQICDPTRWVFEGAKPYVYVGPSDHYDEGGNKLRMAMLQQRPIPLWDPTKPQIALTFPKKIRLEVWMAIARTLKSPDAQPMHSYTRDQIGFLANLSPETYGPYAAAFYDALKKAKMLTYMPLDNQRRIERERAQ